MASNAKSGLLAAAASDKPPAKGMDVAELNDVSPDASWLKRRADKSPPREKNKGKAAAPAIAPDKVEDLPEPPEDEDDEEENLEKKKLRYAHLWHKVATSGEDHVHVFTKAFRNIDDATASSLNTMLRNMNREKVKKELQWDETNDMLTRALLDLIR